MKKKLEHFLTVVFLSSLLLPLFAFLDVIGWKMWKTACSGVDWCSIYASASRIYMMQFWIFAYALIIVIAIMYYLWKKDISESIAIFLTPFILLQGGLEDIIFYLLRGLPLLSAELNWLWVNDHPSKYVSQLMGLETVTGVSLIVTFIISLFILVGALYFLYKWEKWQC